MINCFKQISQKKELCSGHWGNDQTT